jgi:hypothetical protein
MRSFAPSQYRVGGAIMGWNLKYPKWQEPVATAILEFDPLQLAVKIQRAEEAIANRFQELELENDNDEERRLLSDSLSILRDLKEARLGSSDKIIR